MEIQHENLKKLLKRDTVKRSTFEFWCPDISAQEHQMSKLLCITPPSGVMRRLISGPIWKARKLG